MKTIQPTDTAEKVVAQAMAGRPPIQLRDKPVAGENVIFTKLSDDVYICV